MNTKIILELGCNHNGNIEIAKKMIDEAGKLNVYGIKLQKRDIESISDEKRNEQRLDYNSFGKTYYEHRKALEFNCEQILELKEYTENKNLKFIITVFDLKSAIDMIRIGIKYIKIPSQLYCNYQINFYLLTQRQIFNDLILLCSTGMHTLNEIIEWCYFDKFDVTYYCRSMYPFDFTKMNLAMMMELKKSLYKSELGYSSHDDDIRNVKYTLLCGAKWIERHFTLDKKMKGSDHHTVSSEPQDIKIMIDEIKIVENMLGDKNDNKNFLLNDEEEKIKKAFRK